LILSQYIHKKKCVPQKKKKKKINILEFGLELGKENWSLEICVAFYLFFQGSIIA
jgi:hypothetical protein